MLKMLLVAGAAVASSCASSMQSAVVVGGGVTGLATALVLSRRHGYNVTVLEATDSVETYDPTRAYPFLIGERGQKLTKLFPDVQKSLEEEGVASSGRVKLVTISGDPKDIVDPIPKEFFVSHSGTSYWLRRHVFNRIMLDAANKEEKIKIINGAFCKSVSALSDQEIEVCVEEDGSTKTYTAPLVIAADGIKSSVRESLSKSPSAFAGWENYRPKGFKVKKRFSPSSGLKFKTLHLNADAKLPVGDGTMLEIPFNTPVLYVINSVFTGAKNTISLGVLPAKAAPTRTFNVIRIPEHEIWKISDGNELREWFSKAFPRFDFSEDFSLITQKELDRFAKTEGLSFPPVQVCPELYISSPTAESAIVLIGDAVHAFPPDIGEGVNSGLEDVVAFDEALTKHQKIGEVAKAYAAERGPESKALAKIAFVGSPFQYKQSGGMLTVKKIMWQINFLIRFSLFKFSNRKALAPVVVQISDANLKYSEALRRADRLTGAFWAAAAAVFASLVWFIKFF